MQVTFAKTTECNGTSVAASENIQEVTINGEFWGWVAGPSKGMARSRRSWISLKAEDKDKKLAGPFTSWSEWAHNREAALLLSL